MLSNGSKPGIYLKFMLMITAILFASAFFLLKQSVKKENNIIIFHNEDNLQVNNIIAAANNLLKTFDGERLERIKFNFTDEERFNWHYIPRGREGIPIKEFDNNQQKLFKNLLGASLSQKGIEKTEGVIILESVLQDLSGEVHSEIRDFIM